MTMPTLHKFVLSLSPAATHFSNSVTPYGIPFLFNQAPRLSTTDCGDDRGPSAYTVGSSLIHIWMDSYSVLQGRDNILIASNIFLPGV